MNKRLSNYQWMIFVVVGVLSFLLVFGHALIYSFWQDDFNLLQFVHDKSLQDYVRISFTPPTEILPLNLGVVFRPIPHYIFFKVLQSLFGNNPLPFRLANFGIYFVSSILVVILVTMVTSKSRVGWLAGTLFLLNRVFVTPLFWISDNNELFLCLFSLSSVITFLLFLQKGDALRWLYFLISLISLVCGILSKETAISIPFLIVAVLLFKIYLPSIDFRRRLLKCIAVVPHAVVVLVFLIIRFPLITYAVSGGGGSYYKISTFQSLFNGSFWGLWWSIESFTEPWKTFIDLFTQRLASFSIFQPLLISGLFLAITLLSGFLFVRRSKNIAVASPIFLGALWFLISAAPSLVTGILVDYLFALPVVGFLLVISYILDYFVADYLKLSGKKIASILTGIICLSMISAVLVVNRLEFTTWPVALMKYTDDTINLVKKHEFKPEEDKTVCFIDIPEDVWFPGRAEAAFQVFVNPDIHVIELNSQQSANDSHKTCPKNALRIGIIDQQIAVVS